MIDAAFLERAAARRATWTGGTAPSHEAMAELDEEFWRTAPPSARFDAVWQMALEAWTIEGEHGPAPRLQGSPCGVRR